MSPDADADAATARLTTAHRLLLAHRDRLPLPDAPLTPTPPPPSRLPVGASDVDSVLVVGPKEDVYWALHQACDTLGDVTYADPEAGLIEARIPAPDGGTGADASTLLVTLQGRAAGTEAFFTLESPDADRAPSLPALVDAIARLIAPQ